MEKMIGYLLLCVLLIQSKSIEGRGNRPPPPPKKWLTLQGAQPDIVAQGGYSGFFPDSSLAAYDFAQDISIPGTVLYCNLHFTKDGEGFCVAQINLQNATNVEEIDPKGQKAYNIYGRDVRGWFGLDYPAQFVFEKLILRQNIFTRQGTFDGAPVVSPALIAVDKNNNPRRLWLNVEYDLFYNQLKISPESYILQALQAKPEFISSAEIGFLKSIRPKLGKSPTKLIFRFLGLDESEPTTKEKYGSLITKLAMIKTFASGILVPKEYIFPVNNARILQPATSLVLEAHKQGLTVYASGFANDNFLSYNYSYDPTQEYLQFVDNSQFSVDGVLSEFPSTASEAIGCLPQGKNGSRTIKSLIISHNGASGDFPGATDLAYQRAIEDGVDVIDCSVQMSKDGIAFCLDRADLIKTTTAATLYMDRSTSIPEVQQGDGIFSFDLTWSEIQALQPQTENYFRGELVRNPANKNSGKFVTLAEFLELAKTKAVSGVMIIIKNAAYLAAKKNFDLVDTVSTALTNATLDKQSTQKVLIQSDDSSVLLKFKDNKNYQRVYYLEDSISGAPEQVAKEVKNYADAVFVHRDAIVVASDNYAFNFTKTIPALHAANVSVYVGFLKNEFENFIFDYMSDPYVELTTLVTQNVDGFMTDFPRTASSFVRSSCIARASPYMIQPMQPGFFYVPQPVAEPPLLSASALVDPPLPAVAKNTPASATSPSPASTPAGSTAPAAPAPSFSTSITVSRDVLLFAAILAFLTILM